MMQTLDGLCVISSLCRNDCGWSTVTAARRANLVCTGPSGRRATVAICRGFECCVKCVSRPSLRGNEITLNTRSFPKGMSRNLTMRSGLQKKPWRVIEVVLSTPYWSPIRPIRRQIHFSSWGPFFAKDPGVDITTEIISLRREMEYDLRK